MDHPKSPDFSLDSYDFNPDPASSPTGPTFDAFSTYSGGFETSPRLGSFGSLALGHNSGPTPFFSSHHSHPHQQSHNPFPAPSPTAHSFTSASTTSAGRPFTPLEGTDLTTISPPLTVGSHPHSHSHAHPHHDPYANPTGSELDETTTRAPDTGRRSSTNSPPSSSASHSFRGASARYNPLASTRPARPTRKSARRGVRRDDDELSDDDADHMVEDLPDGCNANGTSNIGGTSGGAPAASSDIIQRRREEIRRQRIESEQRRRDELRDGYAKLKYALPISNQKSSKVSLLDRAVTYIRQLETSQGSLQTRLDNAEAELTRLRNVNEQLMRNLADQHRAVTLSALAAANAQAASVSASALPLSSTATSTTSSAPSSPSPSPPKKSKPKLPSF